MKNKNLLISLLLINGVVGQTFPIRNGFNIDGGNPVTEISIDATMVSNSDEALVSEKAIKTYVDTEIANADYVEINYGVNLKSPTFGDDALIYSFSDATNVDHIWYDDNSNSYNFVADGDYKQVANARINVGSVITDEIGLGVTDPLNTIHILDNISFPNNTNSDPNAWNADNKAHQRLEAGNNAMVFGVDNVTNSRKGWIQVGHSSDQYASTNGVLHLQPFGGGVGIGLGGGSVGSDLRIKAEQSTAIRIDQTVSNGEFIECYNSDGALSVALDDASSGGLLRAFRKSDGQERIRLYAGSDSFILEDFGVGTGTPVNRLTVSDSSTTNTNAMGIFAPNLADNNYVALRLGRQDATDGSVGLEYKPISTGGEFSMHHYGDSFGEGLKVAYGGKVGVNVGSDTLKANLHVKPSSSTSSINNVTGILIDQPSASAEAVIAYRTGESSTEQWWTGVNSTLGFGVAWGSEFAGSNTIIRCEDDGSATLPNTTVTDIKNGDSKQIVTKEYVETLEQSWVAVPSRPSGSNLEYMRTRGGIVHLRGRITSGSETTLGTLPSGSRPENITCIPMCGDYVSGPFTLYLYIDASTGVMSYNNTNPSANRYFDGISFAVAD